MSFRNSLEEYKESSKECIDISCLYGNGKYMGNIDKHIIEKIYQEKEGSGSKRETPEPSFSKLIRIKLGEDKIYNCYKFTNELTLIVDLIKKYFFIRRNFYDVVSITNEKNIKELYIIYEYENDITLMEYKSDNKKIGYLVNDSIKRIIAFNWLLCIKRGTNNIENKIFVRSGIKHLTRVKECRSVILFTNPEKNYYLNSETSFDIPKHILNEWFEGKIENFYISMKEMIRGIDENYFREELKKIIGLYNNDYLYWLNSVIERFRFVKNMDLGNEY